VPLPVGSATHRRRLSPVVFGLVVFGLVVLWANLYCVGRVGFLVVGRRSCAAACLSIYPEVRRVSGLSGWGGVPLRGKASKSYMSISLFVTSFCPKYSVEGHGLGVSAAARLGAYPWGGAGGVGRGVVSGCPLVKPRVRLVWVGSRIRCRGCPSRRLLPSSLCASWLVMEVPARSSWRSRGCGRCGWGRELGVGGVHLAYRCRPPSARPWSIVKGTGAFLGCQWCRPWGVEVADFGEVEVAVEPRSGAGGAPSSRLLRARRARSQ
jgi:hypothetical protein